MADFKEKSMFLMKAPAVKVREPAEI